MMVTVLTAAACLYARSLAGVAQLAGGVTAGTAAFPALGGALHAARQAVQRLGIRGLDAGGCMACSAAF